MSKRVIGLDIETYDPLLKTAGYSWKYEQGYILNTALYFEADDKVSVVAGINNDNCPYSRANREINNSIIKRLLKNPDVLIVLVATTVPNYESNWFTDGTHTKFIEEWLMEC